MLHVVVLKSGELAADLHPYLGVAAHAVLVKADDLSYVHAHPMGASQPMDDGAHGEQSDTPLEHNSHGDHAAPAATDDAKGHDNGHSDMTMTVSPELTLHMTPPGPGDYTLFLEFIGGSDVHTIAVPSISRRTELRLYAAPSVRFRR